MKHLLTLILVALCAACGGAEFSSAESFGAAGEDSSAGTGSVTVTAGSGTGGAGGAPQGGSSTGGSGASAATGAGSVHGGSSAACDPDLSTIAAVLPKQITWSEMRATSGQVCVACHNSPCQAIDVVSWGEPEVQADGSIVLRPNTSWPMVDIDVGVNDGVCTAESSCGSKLTSLMVFLTVEESFVTEARAVVVFQGNACLERAGADPSMWSQDLESEIANAITGLHFGCAK